MVVAHSCSEIHRQAVASERLPDAPWRELGYLGGRYAANYAVTICLVIKDISTAPAHARDRADSIRCLHMRLSEQGLIDFHTWMIG